MQTQLGIRLPVQYPPAPIIAFTEEQREHSVLFRLQQSPFFFVSPVRTDETFQELGGIVLARSRVESQEGFSWLLTGTSIPIQPRDPRQWEVTEHRGPHTIMVALHATLPSAFPNTGRSESAAEARVLVVGSGAMLRDEFLPPADSGQAQQSESFALALNAIDWLAADEDLIAIRAKSIRDPQIEVPMLAAQEELQEEIEEGEEVTQEEADERLNAVSERWENTKLIYQIGAITVPPIIALLFGLIRWQMRKSKRANLQGLRRNLMRAKSR